MIKLYDFGEASNSGLVGTTHSVRIGLCLLLRMFSSYFVSRGSLRQNWIVLPLVPLCLQFCTPGFFQAGTMLFDVQIHREWLRVYEERIMFKQRKNSGSGILDPMAANWGGCAAPASLTHGCWTPAPHNQAGALSWVRLGPGTTASAVNAHLSPVPCTWCYSWHLGCHILTYEAIGVKQGRGGGENLAFTARYMSKQIPLMIGCQAWIGNWFGAEWSAEVKRQRLSSWGLSGRMCSLAGPRVQDGGFETRVDGRQVVVFYPPLPHLQICGSLVFADIWADCTYANRPFCFILSFLHAWRPLTVTKVSFHSGD